MTLSKYLALTGILAFTLMSACVSERKSEEETKSLLSASNVYAVVMEDSSYSGKIIVSMAQGLVASARVVKEPKKGRVLVQDDGSFTYTASADESGMDDFSVVWETSLGRFSNEALVVMEIRGQNDAPVANVDSVSTDEEIPLVISPLSNDRDQEGAQALTIKSIPVAPALGTAVIQAGGKTVLYTPNRNENGNDSFTYEAQDPEGSVARAVVNISIKKVQDGPPVAAPDTATIVEDSKTPAEINPIANDTDPDGPSDILVLAAAIKPPNGSITLDLPANKVFYTPDKNFYGTDVIAYVVSDGNGGVKDGTITVTVSDLNDPPTAVADMVAIDEDSFPVEIRPLANDSDVANENQTMSLLDYVAPPLNQAVITRNGDVLTYTPAANFSGTHTIPYRVTDSGGEMAESQIVVEVRPVNDPPQLKTPQDYTILEDNFLNFDPREADTDAEGDLVTTSKISGGPQHGTATIESNNRITYQPRENYFGTDSLEFELSDAKGAVTTGKVSISITAQNDPPKIKAQDYTVLEDNFLNFDPRDNETDVDGDVVITTKIIPGPQHGTAKIEANNRITYKPNDDYSGTDSLTFHLSDGKGGVVSGTVPIAVTAVNDGPIAVSDVVAIAEDTTTDIDVVGNDSDADGDLLTIEIASLPLNGISEVVNGKIRYTPRPNFHGVEQFTYRITDGKGGEATAAVQINITNINDGPPIALPDMATIQKGQPVVIAVLANDSDPDEDLIQLSAIATLPTKGIASIVGQEISYSPQFGAVGTDMFQYVVTDGFGGISVGTVTVQIVGPNAPPLVQPAYCQTDKDQAVICDVSSFVTDSDSTLTYSLHPNQSPDLKGSFMVEDSASGKFRFVPTPGFAGTTSGWFIVSDGQFQIPVELSIGVYQKYQRMFVSKGLYNGNLGGLTGANNICQQEAQQNGLSGNWIAILGASGQPTIRQRWNVEGEVRDIAGDVIASSEDQLFKSGANILGSFVQYDAGMRYSGTTTDAQVYTGITVLGQNANFDCDGWTRGSAGGAVNMGILNDTGSHWYYASTLAGPGACGEAHHIYCGETTVNRSIPTDENVDFVFDYVVPDQSINLVMFADRRQTTSVKIFKANFSNVPGCGVEGSSDPDKMPINHFTGQEVGNRYVVDSGSQANQFFHYRACFYDVKGNLTKSRVAQVYTPNPGNTGQNTVARQIFLGRVKPALQTSCQSCHGSGGPFHRKDIYEPLMVLLEVKKTPSAERSATNNWLYNRLVDGHAGNVCQGNDLCSDVAAWYQAQFP